jgi:low affinity Fe/Cu permease
MVEYAQASNKNTIIVLGIGIALLVVGTVYDSTESNSFELLLAGASKAACFVCLLCSCTILIFNMQNKVTFNIRAYQETCNKHVIEMMGGEETISAVKDIYQAAGISNGDVLYTKQSAAKISDAASDLIHTQFTNNGANIQ